MNRRLGTVGTWMNRRDIWMWCESYYIFCIAHQTHPFVHSVEELREKNVLDNFRYSNRKHVYQLSWSINIPSHSSLHRFTIKRSRNSSSLNNNFRYKKIAIKTHFRLDIFGQTIFSSFSPYLHHKTLNRIRSQCVHTQLSQRATHRRQSRLFKRFSRIFA